MNEKADIVERLRERNFSLFDGIDRRQSDPLSGEAADEIERLRALPPLRAREEEWRVFRCLRTGNPVGTDTYMIGSPCSCDVCTLSRTAGQEWRVPESIDAFMEANPLPDEPIVADEQTK